MMRIGSHPLRIGPAAQREQHDAATAPDRCVRHSERQAAAAADDGERVSAVRIRAPLTHDAAFESSGLSWAAGFISDRDPVSRMNDRIFAINGSVANSPAAFSARSANVPEPRNNTR